MPRPAAPAAFNEVWQTSRRTCSRHSARAIWQLASNMAGGRLYWLCRMLGEDDLGHSGMFRVDHATVPRIDLQ